MVIGKTLYVKNRRDWHSWLSKHHTIEPEIWLVYYRKETGKPRISYDDAVLEALAFGWIDSTVKGIDEERFAQRFSPRRKTSKLSQMNLERVRELVKQKKMTKAGLAAIAHVYDPKKDPELRQGRNGAGKKETFTIPPSILRALKANKEAWKNFQAMPASYQRIRVTYIESRKRHGVWMYKKALDHFIKMTEQNKRIGFVKERR